MVYDIKMQSYSNWDLKFITLIYRRHAIDFSMIESLNEDEFLCELSWICFGLNVRI